jgi:predicted phosphodiesterase
VRLHVLSDLHLERGIQELPAVEADVLILAGDIDNGTSGVEWARSWASGRPVIYVAGNHEFYGHSLPGLVADLRAVAAGSSVHVLENEALILDGVRFLGCTLWSDFDFDGAENRALAMRVCERAVSDYRVIRHDEPNRPLSPQDTRDRHLESRRWLTARLAEDHDGPTVVVTHHAPHVLWRPPEKVWRLIAGAFVSDLSELMGDPIDLWIYGHTHRAADLEVSGTQLLSNPCGYPTEPVAGFDPALVVGVNGFRSGLAAPRITDA